MCRSSFRFIVSSVEMYWLKHSKAHKNYILSTCNWSTKICNEISSTGPSGLCDLVVHWWKLTETLYLSSNALEVKMISANCSVLSGDQVLNIWFSVQILPQVMTHMFWNVASNLILQLIIVLLFDVNVLDFVPPLFPLSEPLKRVAQICSFFYVPCLWWRKWT